jgi:hypothetical protein
MASQGTAAFLTNVWQGNRLPASCGTATAVQSSTCTDVACVAMSRPSGAIEGARNTHWLMRPQGPLQKPRNTTQITLLVTVNLPLCLIARRRGYESKLHALQTIALNERQSYLYVLAFLQFNGGGGGEVSWVESQWPHSRSGSGNITARNHISVLKTVASDENKLSHPLAQEKRYRNGSWRSKLRKCELVQTTAHWRTSVKAVMKIWVP